MTSQRKSRVRRLLVAVCASLVAATAAAPAQAAFDDPLFVWTPEPPPPPSPIVPPPHGLLEGACGLALDSGGHIYVSDYYNHAVDVFGTPGSTGSYLSQIWP